MATTTSASDTVTQQELSGILGVDRTTIHAHHGQGLRFRAGPGKSNRYATTAAVSWWIGSELSKRLRLSLAGAEPLALGRYTLAEGGNGWAADVVDLGADMGYSEAECLLAVGKVHGLIAAGRIVS